MTQIDTMIYVYKLNTFSEVTFLWNQTYLNFEKNPFYQHAMSNISEIVAWDNIVCQQLTKWTAFFFIIWKVYYLIKDLMYLKLYVFFPEMMIIEYNNYKS